MSRPGRFMNALNAGVFDLVRRAANGYTKRAYTRPVGPRMANRKFYKLNPRSKVGSKTMLGRGRRKALDHKTIQNAGGIITQSSFSSSRRPTAAAYIRKNASSPDYYISNTYDSFSALSGFQATRHFPLIRQTDLQQLLATMGSAAPAGNLTRQFVLSKVISNVVLTNASSASCTIDLYDVATKFDNDLSMLNAFSQGIAMETTLPSGTPPGNVLGIKLWQSQQWNSFFKIIKTRHINLAAGASHKHSISLSPNKILKEQYINENVNYAGLTYFTVAVVRGVPVCDSDDVPRLVSTAPIVIDVVRDWSYKMAWLENYDTDLNIVNNMVTLLQPENMNVFQGQAQPVTSAS